MRRLSQINLVVTDSLTGAPGHPLDITSDITLAANKQVVFTNGGYIGAGCCVVTLVGPNEL